MQSAVLSLAVFILVPSVLGESESVGAGGRVGSGRVEPKKRQRGEDRGDFVGGVWCRLGSEGVL